MKILACVWLSTSWWFACTIPCNEYSLMYLPWAKTAYTNKSEEDGQNHRFPAIIHPAFSEYLNMLMQQRCLGWRRYSIMMFLLCRHYSLPFTMSYETKDTQNILFKWTWQQECYASYFCLLIWQTLQSDLHCTVPSRLDCVPCQANPWPWHCWCHALLDELQELLLLFVSVFGL